MIIRGILDRSLSNQLCVRGFAELGDLEKISKADDSYQRDLIKEQQKTIEKFLTDKEYLFFPEVILSVHIPIDISRAKAGSSLPLAAIEQTGKFTSNVYPIKFKCRRIPYKSEDIRRSFSLQNIEIEIDDNFIEERRQNGTQIFHRIDGNHRLSAAKELNRSEVSEIVAPFCIILFNEIIAEIISPEGGKQRMHDSTGYKFEKVVFYNINSKSVPLTQEENLRVILDDVETFPDSELKEKFGWHFFAAREVLKGLPKELDQAYPNLHNAFASNARRIIIDLIELLLTHSLIQRNESSLGDIKKALVEVNQQFGNYPQLRDSKNYSFFIASICLFLSKENNVELFISWLIKNHIVEINELKASSLISIYKKIRESKRKQIFVSMQFDDDSKVHYDAIKKTIEEINNQYKQDIKLREIRIDDFTQGHSYKIDDEILQLIEDSGLLIADISFKNVNVYQELGYLMGLNAGKGFKQENFILIKKETTRSKETDVGFNIRPYQQIRFKSDLLLVKKLKNAIVEYYGLA